MAAALPLPETAPACSSLGPLRGCRRSGWAWTCSWHPSPPPRRRGSGRGYLPACSQYGRSSAREPPAPCWRCSSGRPIIHHPQTLVQCGSLHISVVRCFHFGEGALLLCASYELVFESALECTCHAAEVLLEECMIFVVGEFSRDMWIELWWEGESSDLSEVGQGAGLIESHDTQYIQHQLFLPLHASAHHICVRSDGDDSQRGLLYLLKVVCDCFGP
mmetsp:Transcript_14535/g.32666  ORF Transcript_14535/g.32666 Transcript_14535/m.32666 type:complete len:218 (+) Transcript_14535:575-1228(+)